MEAVTLEEKRLYREVSKQTKAMSDEAIACRANNHSWNTPLTAEKRRGGWYIRVACSNDCGCIRQQWLDNWGLVESSKIDYPKDRSYLLKGVGRLTGFGKGAFRVANLERTIGRMKAAK